jgi:hypothetical protein
MKASRVVFGLLLFCFIGSVQAAADFSGNWVLNTKKGENLGMVAALEQTLVMTQTDAQLTLDYTNVFQGSASDRKVTLDLSGAAADNPAAMGDPSKTESAWDGDDLVTTWTTEGAIPGTSVTRTETIALGADGTMTISTVRANKPTMILVYEKQ